MAGADTADIRLAAVDIAAHWEHKVAVLWNPAWNSCGPIAEAIGSFDFAGIQAAGMVVAIDDLVEARNFEFDSLAELMALGTVDLGKSLEQEDLAENLAVVFDIGLLRMVRGVARDLDNQVGEDIG